MAAPRPSKNLIVLIIIIIILVILVIFTVWWAYSVNPHHVEKWWESKLSKTYKQNELHRRDLNVENIVERIQQYSENIYSEAIHNYDDSNILHVKSVVGWTGVSKKIPSLKKSLFKNNDRVLACRIFIVEPNKTFLQTKRSSHFSKFKTIYSIDKFNKVREVTTEKNSNNTDSIKIFIELEIKSIIPSSYHNTCNNIFYRFLRHNKYNKKIFNSLNKNVSETG